MENLLTIACHKPLREHSPILTPRRKGTDGEGCDGSLDTVRSTLAGFYFNYAQMSCLLWKAEKSVPFWGPIPSKHFMGCFQLQFFFSPWGCLCIWKGGKECQPPSLLVHAHHRLAPWCRRRKERERASIHGTLTDVGCFQIADLIPSAAPWLGWPARLLLPWGPNHRCIPPRLGFLLGCWELISGPHARATYTLSVQLSP